MIEEIEHYLDDLEVSSVLRDRVQLFIDLISSISADSPLQGIFLANGEDENGRPSYTSLWLWSEKFIHECHDFQLKVSFDSILVAGTTYWKLESTNFQLGMPTTSSSRLAIYAKFPHGISGNMTATGTNCSYLEKFFRVRLMNVYHPGDSDGVLG
ncbi:hypothetical protein ACEXQE_04775 [Herbiconiux sp. P17]|uniref:hypothetical protein n=1 Tax=Herbiconiux wuyangfengii TaxID=3342794 RepID=UPI0035BB37F6